MIQYAWVSLIMITNHDHWTAWISQWNMGLD